MARKPLPQPSGAALPDPDDVLRVMLSTPPQPHSTSAKKAKGKANPTKKKRATR